MLLPVAHGEPYGQQPVPPARVPVGLVAERVHSGRPREEQRRVLDAYRSGTAPQWPAYAYSDRLRGLFDVYEAWAAQHDDLVGSLDFDWWINAQDWELRSVELFEEPEGPDRTTILARFDNAGRIDLNRFKFVRQDGRWYLDDVVNGHRDEEGWVLSELLRERPE